MLLPLLLPTEALDLVRPRTVSQPSSDDSATAATADAFAVFPVAVVVVAECFCVASLRHELLSLAAFVVLHLLELLQPADVESLAVVCRFKVCTFCAQLWHFTSAFSAFLPAFSLATFAAVAVAVAVAVAAAVLQVIDFADEEKEEAKEKEDNRVVVFH